MKDLLAALDEALEFRSTLLDTTRKEGDRLAAQAFLADRGFKLLREHGPALREALVRAQESQWISVSERLPEESDALDRKFVLAYFDWGKRDDSPSIQFAEISCGHWRPYGGNGDFDKYVTHWMPMPKLPYTLRAATKESHE